LFDRWEITPKSKAESLAKEIRKSFDAGTKDLTQLLIEREDEIDRLSERLDKYEPRFKPKKSA